MRAGESSRELGLFWVLLAIALLANLLATANGLFPQDSASYAVLSKHMVVTGNWLELYLDGEDFLDKPHFPFWASALAMHFLGVTVFAYKLPAFVFFLVGLLYTYLLARDLHGARVARLATLLLAVSLHVVVSNSDVRAEPFLLGLIVPAVYHLRRASGKRWLGHLIAGSLFTAAALMTKGPFLLIPTFGAVIGDAILRRRPRELLRARWLVALVLVLVFILPEIWALYVQFDLHPEKTLWGRTGLSGVRFFFWDSQFGRFLNTGPIQGKGDPFFFLHTVAWAFAPAGLIAFGALGRTIGAALRGEQRDFVAFSAAIPLFLVFSISRFQLPHYTNILFPFFAIMVAEWVLSLKWKGGKLAVALIQYGHAIGLALVIVFLQIFSRPGHTDCFVAALVLLLAVNGLVWKLVAAGTSRALLMSVASSAVLGCWTNAAFIPALLDYESGSVAARYVNADPTKRQAAVLEVNGWVYDMYLDLDKPMRRFNADTVQRSEAAGMLVYTNDRALRGLDERGFVYRILESFDHYNTLTRLTPKFLYHATRASRLERRHIVEIDA
ncbi:MAG: glycosyl transferase [Planctomycetes bacterium]|nr:glycosyl transferase [Planctomycetota bacterium]